MSEGRSSLKRASKLPKRLEDFEVDKTGDFGMGEKEAEIDETKRFLERQRKSNKSGTPKKTSRAVSVPSSSTLRGQTKKAIAGASTSSKAPAASGSALAKFKSQSPPSSARKRNRQPVDYVVEFSNEGSTDQERDLDDSDDEDFVPNSVKATRAVPVPSASSVRSRVLPKKATAGDSTSLKAPAASGSALAKSKARPPPSSTKKQLYQPKACVVKSSKEESSDQASESEDSTDYDDSADEDFEPGNVSSDSEHEPTIPKASKTPSQPVNRVRPSATAQAILARTPQSTSQRLTLDAPTVLSTPQVSLNSKNQEPSPKRVKLYIPLRYCPPEVAEHLRRNSNVYKKLITNVRLLKVRSASQTNDGERGFVADQESSDSTLTNSRSASPSQDNANKSSADEPLTTASFAPHCSNSLPFVSREALIIRQANSHSPQQPDVDDNGLNEHHMDLYYDYIPSEQEEREIGESDDDGIMEKEPEEQEQDDTWTPESHSLLEENHDVATSEEDVLFGDVESSGEDNGDVVVNTMSSTPIAPLPSSCGSSDQPIIRNEKNFEVEVFPKRMFFNAPFYKSVGNSMHLKNNSDGWLAYKILFSNPERHFSADTGSLIQPNQTSVIPVICKSFGGMEAWDEGEVYEIVIKFVKMPEGEWQWIDAWFEDEEVVETKIIEIRHSN